MLSAFRRRRVVTASKRCSRLPYSVACLLLAVLAAAGCSQGRHTSGGSEGTDANAIERKAAKGPVTLVVRVSPREPRLSDLLEMDVMIEAPSGVEVKPPSFGQAVGDFLIRDYTERPPRGGTKGRRFHYELEPAYAGKHLIRSVSVEFIDNRPNSEQSGKPALVETEPLEVDVKSELAGGVPSLAKLEPMVPPKDVSRATALGWLAGITVIVALAVVGFFVLRRRKKASIEAPQPTPEEIAHAALAALLGEDLPARGLVKEFYLRLTGIVRQYVEATTGIHAPEQTTEEFLRDIRSRAIFSPERSVRLADFLESADLVKYAGQTPDKGQIDQAIARAQEFVNLPADTPAVSVLTTQA